MTSTTTRLGTVVLKIQAISKRYGETDVLNSVSLDVCQGDVLGVLGPSGAGKSTLLRCIDLLVPPDEGEVHYFLGPDYLVNSLGAFEHPGNRPAEAARVRRSLGIVFQHLGLWPERTVLANLILAPMIVLGEAKEVAVARARALALRFGIENKVESRVYELSGGQKQRAALIRTLMMNPRVLLLDEVTPALDPFLTVNIMDAIRLLREDGLTMIIVTHHVDFAAKVCNRVAYLEGGKLLEVADVSDCVINPSTPAFRRFLSAVRGAR